MNILFALSSTPWLWKISFLTSLPLRLFIMKENFVLFDSQKSITAINTWDKTRLISDQSSKLFILELLNYNCFTANKTQSVLGPVNTVV